MVPARAIDFETAADLHADETWPNKGPATKRESVKPNGGFRLLGMLPRRSHGKWTAVTSVGGPRRVKSAMSWRSILFRAARRRFGGHVKIRTRSGASERSRASPAAKAAGPDHRGRANARDPGSAARHMPMGSRIWRVTA